MLSPLMLLLILWRLRFDLVKTLIYENTILGGPDVKRGTQQRLKGATYLGVNACLK